MVQKNIPIATVAQIAAYRESPRCAGAQYAITATAPHTDAIAAPLLIFSMVGIFLRKMPSPTLRALIHAHVLSSGSTDIMFHVLSFILAIDIFAATCAIERFHDVSQVE